MVKPYTHPLLLRQLTDYWTQIESQLASMTYTDYMRAMTSLQALTQDLDRTKAIFGAVSQQASQWNHSSTWIYQELIGEAQAIRLGDRAEWLRLELAAQGASDEALDLYNERVNRFKTTTHD